VSISNASASALVPYTVYTSDILYFSGTLVSFSYSAAYTPTYQWSIFKLDSTTLAPTTQVDLTANPTAVTTNLKLPSNTLTNGLFVIYFQFTAVMPDPKVQVTSAKKSTYINTIPNGLSISALPNNVASFTLGPAQNLTLNPAAYSYDYNSVANMSNLTYSFYCMKMNRNQTSLTNYLSTPGLIDLASAYKLSLQSSTSVTGFGSCFNNICLFLFIKTLTFI
jgi:hypothetical protein